VSAAAPSTPVPRPRAFRSPENQTWITTGQDVSGGYGMLVGLVRFGKFGSADNVGRNLLVYCWGSTGLVVSGRRADTRPPVVSAFAMMAPPSISVRSRMDVRPSPGGHG
jgi:hypothetical protein